jgi:hypothetical protein
MMEPRVPDGFVPSIANRHTTERKVQQSLPKDMNNMPPGVHGLRLLVVGSVNTAKMYLILSENCNSMFMNSMLGTMAMCGIMDLLRKQMAF